MSNEWMSGRALRTPLAVAAVVSTVVVGAAGPMMLGAMMLGAMALGAAQSAAAATYSEAPALKALVEAGQLPPVEQRLPKNPRVLEPLESVGVYGGVWRTGSKPSAPTWNLRTVGYDHMFHWLPDWTGVVPNIAAAFEVSPDARVYTITLREGMKWSDGDPFDTEDILFAYESVFKHADLADFPGYLRSGKESPAKIEKVDAVTFTVTFEKPKASFLEGMAQVTTQIGGDALTKYPAHYMRQFHPDFNQEGLDALVAESGASSWADLFSLKADTWLNPDKPTLNAWMVTLPYGDGNQVVAERNPYYWKVDPEGQQLPYIDRVVFEIVQDPEVLLLKALAGEIDMIGTMLNTVSNKAVLFDGREKADFDFFELVPSDSNLATYSFNQMHKDPVLREVLANKDFRAGLSHAINRQEIIDLVFIGQGTPMQTAVLPSYKPLYNEQLAKQFTEYDVDKANALLDKAGFAERDSDGWRLGPDGKPIEFAILTRADKKFMADSSLMVVEHWKQVGINARVDIVERSLVRSRKNANDHDVIIEDFPGGARDAFLRPTPWVPMHHNAAYGIPWYDWQRGREGGAEPPAHVRRQLELWEEVNSLADPQKREEAMREILQIAADSFYTIGIVVPKAGYGIVSNRMKNVPRTMHGSYWFAPPGPTNPPTYYFVGGKNG
ncbi:ABC transporter substrate-binding protein [Pelagibius sp.]|uniref:ABC transporter substrate-binding protein n=1 Tax=Pelagibius sp. TaxID=1931238 RepID=UPI003B503E09